MQKKVDATYISNGIISLYIVLLITGASPEDGEDVEEVETSNEEPIESELIAEVT